MGWSRALVVLLIGCGRVSFDPIEDRTGDAGGDTLNTDATFTFDQRDWNGAIRSAQENAARAGAPKSMEWYGAFGLLVTLVWLYVELLRLLAKLQSDRR